MAAPIQVRLVIYSVCNAVLTLPSTGKLSLSTSASANKDSKTDSPRPLPSSKRFGESSSHGGKNPFNALNTSSPGLSSPGASAFGLGTGAFASFGASSKVPKTPGTGFSAAEILKAEPLEKDKESGRERDLKVTTGSKVDGWTNERKEKETTGTKAITQSEKATTSLEHPLKHTWVIWYRPPTNKFTDYEKSTVAIGSFSTVEGFWALYRHLKRPSALPTVSDYHIFKKGIRPVWEDEENKRGGKWIIRLKKNVADRYWEDLILGMVGDQFMEAGEEVCGAVMSMRGQEDVLSIWTRIDGGRNIKIRYVSGHFAKTARS